jgi:serine/threonine protein kinase
VHGDIKPQNVLIFKDDTGTFIAKLADFGYSTSYVQADDLVRVPRSRPWNAPECDPLGLMIKPLQAFKMDVFSLGMLFLWLVFERYFCGSEPLPTDMQWAASSFEYQGEHRLRDILEDLKNKDCLALFARQLLAMESGLDVQQIKELNNFFSESLAFDPALREVDIEDSLKRLGLNRYANFYLLIHLKETHISKD